MEPVKNDPEIAKNLEKVKIEVDKLQHNAYNFISSFIHIGINENRNLVVSKNELKFWGPSLSLFKTNPHFFGSRSE